MLDALIVMIEQAGLTIGDRLPPEHELAARLQVGRSTVREALKAWQSMGIVSRNKGAGTVLAAEVASNAVHVPITLQLEAESLLRTNGVRRPLEIEATRLAAANASGEQRRRIVARAEALIAIHARGDDWRDADAQFHAAVHAASGHPLFAQPSRRIRDVFLDLYPDPLGVPLLGDASIPLHGDLARALAAGDAAAAVRHMLAISRSVDDEVRKRLDVR